MRIKQPQFWKTNNKISMALWPLSLVYRLVTKIREMRAKPFKSQIPVICVGNVNIGGAGKTPVTIEVAKILQEQGKKVAFLSRGYGGYLYGPVRVDLEKHDAKQVGDEPLLLREIAPVYVAKNRTEGLKLISLSETDVIIMDDGLQNPNVVKDMCLLVIDGSYGVGNGQVLPAGPLRESLQAALSKVTATIFIGDDATKMLPLETKIIRAKILPHNHEKFIGKDVIAFAGIGNPEKFFGSLKELGGNIMKKVSFPDHYMYKEAELENLLKEANECGAMLVTTKKDFVRLDAKYKEKIQYLSIEISFSDKAVLEETLKLVF